MMEITNQPAEFQSLKLVRDFIEITCKGYPQVDEQSLFDLKLAVDEACTNIILHGYAGSRAGRITVSCKVGEDRAIIQISDTGRPFEMRERAKPDIGSGLKDGRVGGFGVHFIYRSMDDVIYETDELVNRLTLVKKLNNGMREA